MLKKEHDDQTKVLYYATRVGATLHTPGLLLALPW